MGVGSDVGIELSIGTTMVVVLDSPVQDKNKKTKIINAIEVKWVELINTGAYLFDIIIRELAVVDT